MKRLLGFYLFLLLAQTATTQELVRDTNLYHAQCFTYRKQLIYFGFLSDGAKSIFKCKKINTEGKEMAGFEISLPKNYNDYHEINYDTLHNKITFSFPEIGNDKTLNQIRTDSGFVGGVLIKDCDVARVNSFWIFDNEKYFYNNLLYRVRERKDTSGKFYLQQFHVKDFSQVYDYVPDWQFNFKRNLYSACHIFYADANSVWLFVNILDGSKKGQWILKLSVLDGETMAACKLNDLFPGEEFLFSKSVFNFKSNEMILALPSLNVARTTNSDINSKLNDYELRLLYLDSVLENKNTFKINWGPKHFTGINRAQTPCNYAVREIQVEEKYLNLELELLAKETEELFSTAALTYVKVNTDQEWGKIELVNNHYMTVKNIPLFKNMDGKSYRNLYKINKSEIQDLFYKTPDVRMIHFQNLQSPIVLYGIYSVAEKENWVAEKFYYSKGKPTIKRLVGEKRSNFPGLFLVSNKLLQFSRIANNKGMVLRKINSEE